MSRVVAVAAAALLAGLSSPAVSHDASHHGPTAEETALRQAAAEAARSLMASIDAWRAAVVAADRAGLERAYHDSLSYGHTDGEVLGKTEQIDRTLRPGSRFTAVDISEPGVRFIGDLALLTAGWTFHIRADDGRETTARLAGLDVWQKVQQPAGETSWQLVARQLTRLPAAQPQP